MNPHKLADWFRIALRTKRVYYTVDHQSRTNMGAAYSFYVVWKGRLWKAWPSNGESFDAKLASDLGFRLTRKWRSFYRGGCGYDRAHDVIYSMAMQFAPKGHSQEALKRCNSISLESLGDNG